jgi:tRNA G18 (ribose-2'-O)-methylase SpoU
MSNHSTKSAPLFSNLGYSIKGEGPIVVAYQLKSPENMGHIIRLAANFGCSKVIFIGDKLQVRESKIKKVGGAATGQVDWCFISEDNWLDYMPEDYQMVAIETTKDSQSITSFKMPEKVAFLLGNEIYGLPDELVKRCSCSVHIPMVGAIKSMNVSHACSVAFIHTGKWSLKPLLYL